MNAMQIADLRIENFRGIGSGHIRFGAHTAFIGPNNCGKTTVIEALALLFGRDRMERTLTRRRARFGDFGWVKINHTDI
jgi:putative ATP-dependent endonuclease of OLD family